MTKYDIKQSGDGGVRVIGSVDWSPEDWDYQTSDAAVGRLLAEVKDKGAVNGFKSVTEGDVIYDFVPTKVESSNPNFIGHLSDYLGRVTEMPGTGSVWIREQNNTGGQRLGVPWGIRYNWGYRDICCPTPQWCIERA